MRKAKIYYAHPMSLYNTPQEERDLEMIKRLHPLAIIINPNCPESQDGYKEKGMDYFYDLIKDCDYFYFRAFPDLKIGAGVWGELKQAEKSCVAILEIPIITDSRYLNIDDTREYLKQAGQR